MAGSTVVVPQIQPVRRPGVSEAVLQRFLRKRWAVAALIFILLEVIMAIFAPLIAPYDPYHSDYIAAYKGPSPQHWLGADDLGRDVLSRIIYGGRVSYTVGVFSQIFIVAIGLPIGAIAGLIGGWVDYVLMRLIDVLSSIPGLLFYILLMIVLGAGIG